MKPIKRIAERITELMNSKAISQSELSRRTGITASSLSDYINGKYSPKQDKIDLIARALGVTPAYLMGWEEPTPQPITIAAHATEDLDADDIEEINRFIDYIKNRKKR